MYHFIKGKTCSNRYMAMMIIDLIFPFFTFIMLLENTAAIILNFLFYDYILRITSGVETNWNYFVFTDKYATLCKGMGILFAYIFNP